MNPEELFNSNLSLIEEICKAQLSKRQIYNEKAKDCESTIRLKLIENNYHKIARFQGRAKFNTYITTVIINIILDNCIQSKDPLDNIYEPPADNEDGFTDAFASMPANTLTPEESIINKQAQLTQSKMYDIIKAIAKDLSNQDRLMLKMIYIEDIDVSKTARRLHQERKTVDKRVKEILAQFKKALLSSGIHFNEAINVIRCMEQQHEQKIALKIKNSPSNTINTNSEGANDE
jgi:RNA polymerase sigma factor (sigma-70 family)